MYARYAREMGCEPSELANWLPQAMGEYFSQTGFWLDRLHVLGPKTPLISIRATTLARRRIALMNLPVTRVEFDFPEDWPSQKIELCMARFDLYTRRGGG
jgi:hypothetical protein